MISGGATGAPAVLVGREDPIQAWQAGQAACVRYGRQAGRPAGGYAPRQPAHCVRGRRRGAGLCRRVGGLVLAQAQVRLVQQAAGADAHGAAQQGVQRKDASCGGPGRRRGGGWRGIGGWTVGGGGIRGEG